MRHLFVSSLALTLLSTSSTTASADPIPLVAVIYELPEAPYSHKVVDLPDLSHGGSVVLDTSSISRHTVFVGPPRWYTYAYQNDPIDEKIGFYVGVKDPNNSSFSQSNFPIGDPHVLVWATVRGAIVGEQGDARLGASYTSTIDSVSLSASPGQPVPPTLLDMVQHPEHIHLSGSTTMGYDGLQHTLTLDPPTPGSPSPVPEPKVLSTFLLGIGAWVLRRRIPSAS